MSAAALGFALSAAVLFAAALVLSAFGLRHRSARRGAAVSIPTAAALFVLLAPFALDVSGFSWRAAAIFAAAGLGYPALVTLLTFEAARRSGPGVAGALGNLTPLFAVLFAAVALGETPRAGQLAGAAAIVAGVMLISFPGGGAARAALGWALALPLAAAALRGAIQPAVKAGLALWPDAFAAALIGYIVSAAVVAGSAGLGGAPPARAPRRAGILWFALVGLGNGCAVLSLYAALARAPVALVSPVVATYPLFALAFGAALLRGAHPPSRRQAAGVAATVAGVALLLAG